ncbi:hypothetical protein J3R83DRAFT_3552 [Lanmaoa asiatica]|nr:hypothetical protein J3R83DRAFT_3552 [Lanmaoa asiatica]
MKTSFTTSIHSCLRVPILLLLLSCGLWSCWRDILKFRLAFVLSCSTLRHRLPLSRLTPEEIESLYNVISDHHYLNNIARESLRLVPPIHSSLRVATQDDEIPTSYPVHLRDGSISDERSIHIRKGDFVHVPIEAFNLDKEIWGENAWEFE